MKLFIKIRLIDAQRHAKEFEDITAYEQNFFLMHFIHVDYIKCSEIKLHFWLKTCNQQNMVWIVFITCLHGHTREFRLSMTVVGNSWMFISSCFMQFLNKLILKTLYDP